MSIFGSGNRRKLRAKYGLKAACLPVNVCLLRSSIMIATLAIAPTLRARFSRAMVLLAIMCISWNSI